VIVKLRRKNTDRKKYANAECKAENGHVFYSERHVTRDRTWSVGGLMQNVDDVHARKHAS